MSISQTILDVAEICALQGVHNLILSPGSRNAPLALSFRRHTAINTRIISDERAAGYIAMGMAQSLKKPVIILSTSGTAVLNFGPAIAEAFYQQIPLLVFTADRPPEWIDQYDGQTIRQREVFKNHVKKSFEIPVSTEHPDARWQIHRVINEAIVTCGAEIPGPVHVNFPFREPLYPDAGQPWEYSGKVPLVSYKPAKNGLHLDHWKSLKDQWAAASRILIVGGQRSFSARLTASLDNLQAHAGIPVLGDAISNLHRVHGVIQHMEIILGQSHQILESLRPDLLITFGNGVISKNLKLFLRKFAPARHWHIQESGYPPDTFQSLSEIISMRPAAFFTKLPDHISSTEGTARLQEWVEQETRARKWINEFLDQQPFNELQAVQQVIKAANEVHLHLANSSPVRWVDLIGVAPETIEVSANRGTSGIDGCTSAAVGHSLVNNRPNLLITGDMALFYDRHAFWHQYKIPNLNIVMLNNHGGGIFRLIDGPREQPELEELFVTRQNLSAETIAKDFGMKYLYCDNHKDLKGKVVELFQPQEQAIILEIEVPNNMGDIYNHLKARIKNSYE